MMMIDYKEGGGVKNLGKDDYIILAMQFLNFYQTNLYFST